ncbi:MAG: hypothetical protein KGR26_06060 [Cyanobacteria bacterium REEB65]|nr:hypothetical protein [Cyanobacteria bacterium REEB65]
MNTPGNGIAAGLEGLPDHVSEDLGAAIAIAIACHLEADQRTKPLPTASPWLLAARRESLGLMASERHHTVQAWQPKLP